VTSRRLPGFALVLVGAAGFAACLRSAFTGMRDLMVTDGGSCASGGPYVSAHPCSGSDVRLLTVGIVGGLVAIGILTIGSARLGRSGISPGLLAWAALFGALGWNFLSLGLHPPAGQSGAAGWLIAGVVFWLMAAGGLGPAIGEVAGMFRTAGRTSPVSAAALPLVRAIQLPGMAVPQAGPVPGPDSLRAGNGGYPGGIAAGSQPGRGTDLAGAALWLATIVAGAVAGIVLGAALVSLLR
jgi:hypothetical protein